LGKAAAEGRRGSFIAGMPGMAGMEIGTGSAFGFSAPGSCARSAAVASTARQAEARKRIGNLRRGITQRANHKSEGGAMVEWGKVEVSDDS
jgi:hypothetical protein